MSNSPDDLERRESYRRGSYRRSMLRAWSELARERDETVRLITDKLEEQPFDRAGVGSLLDTLAEKDRLLRDNRVQEYATWFDRALVAAPAMKGKMWGVVGTVWNFIFFAVAVQFGAPTPGRTLKPHI